VILIKKGIKKYIVTVLVFYSVLRILFKLAAYFSFSGPFALIALLLVILLSFIFTSLLVNERNDENA
jgi:hypothetical protein